MNEFFWHVDEAFMALVDKPLTVLGVIFALMIGVTTVMAIRAKGDSDDA